MIYIKILALIALIFSVIWLIVTPSWEPAVVVVVSISTFIAPFLIKTKENATTQTQSVRDGSIGVQASGDVTVGGSLGVKDE